MSEDALGRRFEFAVDGNDFAEALVHGVMELRADQLAGEPFKTSELGSVDDKRTWCSLNDTTIETYFIGKVIHIKDGEREVYYNACLSYLRPRTTSEVWPQPDDEDDESTSGVLLLVDHSEADEDDDDEDDDDEDDDDIAELNDLHYVQEVWDYFVGDDGYMPRANVRREYYNANGRLLGILGMEDPTTADKMLSEVMDEDIDLQTKDACFSRTFSELDVALIEAICNNDLPKINEFLGKIGCFDDEPRYMPEWEDE